MCQPLSEATKVQTSQRKLKSDAQTSRSPANQLRTRPKPLKIAAEACETGPQAGETASEACETELGSRAQKITARFILQLFLGLA